MVNGKNGATGPNATHLVIAATSSELESAEIQLTEARTVLATQQRQHHAHRTPLIQVKAFQIEVNQSVNKIIHQFLFLWISSTLSSPPQAT